MIHDDAVRRSMRIPVELARKLDRLAANNGRSANAELIAALERHTSNQK